MTRNNIIPQISFFLLVAFNSANYAMRPSNNSDSKPPLGMIAHVRPDMQQVQNVASLNRAANARQHIIGPLTRSQHSSRPDPLFIQANRMLQEGNIKGIIAMKNDLEGQLQSTFGKRAVETQIAKLEMVLNDPLVKCYEECNAKRLEGDWAYLQKRITELDCRLKIPEDLPGEEAERLFAEKAIVQKQLNDPSTQWLMALAEGHSQAALCAWRSIEQAWIDKHIDRKTYDAARSHYIRRKDVQELKRAQSSEQHKRESTLNATQENPNVSSGKREDTTDMVLTTPSKIVNIHPKVDQHVEETLCGLSEQHSDFESYMDAIGQTLKEMHQSGFLIPRSDIEKEVIKHGVKHYFKSLIPTNPLEHPGTYTANLIRYTALAGIHTATSGVLLPVHVAADVALKLHAIQSADTARMTSEQYAEFVAEELADITYQVAANRIASTVQDSGIPQGFVRMTREMLKGDPEAAIAGGGSASASAASPEEPSLQTFSKKKDCGGNAGNEPGAAAARYGSAVGESVPNMTALFEKNDFGRALKRSSVKTKFVDVTTNSQIYEVIEKLPEYGLKKGDKLYLDKFHGDHIEVFRGKKCSTVLNLDGTINERKEAVAFAENRRLRIR